VTDPRPEAMRDLQDMIAKMEATITAFEAMWNRTLGVGFEPSMEDRISLALLAEAISVWEDRIIKLADTSGIQLKTHFTHLHEVAPPSEAMH
jgi:hypothetical protein